MPNRILKETICTSRNLNRLDPDAERLFYRLIVKCDDFGRFHATPEIVRAFCFPLQLESVSLAHIRRWLDGLAGEGLIVIYSAAGQDYLYLRSKFPDPPAGSPAPAPARTCAQTPAADGNGAQVHGISVPVTANRDPESETYPESQSGPYPEAVSKTDSTALPAVESAVAGTAIKAVPGSHGKGYMVIGMDSSEASARGGPPGEDPSECLSGAELDWRDVKEDLRAQLAPGIYDMALANTRGLSWKGAHLTVAVPTRTVRDMLCSRLKVMVARSLARVVDGTAQVTYEYPS